MRNARTAGGTDGSAGRPVEQVAFANRLPAQPADLRRQNLSALIRGVIAAGSVARAELAVITGLAPGTVTKLTAALSEVGLIRELDSAAGDGRRGRPRIPVAMDERSFRVAGIHLGYLRTTVCLVDLRGALVGEVRIRHRSLRFDKVISEAVEGLRQLIDRHGGELLGVGVSTGGWVDAGSAIEQPMLGWHDVAIEGTLRGRLELPVRVDSNVRALALAESWLGAGKDVRNLAYLFVGNVVGAGFVLDGRVYRGTHAAAGTLDHLPVDGLAPAPCACGRRNCLHAVASDVALMRRACSAGLVDERGTADDLIALARAGDRKADGLLRDRARVVGDAVALLLEMLDPEVVVVGGGVVDAEEYLPAVREGAHARRAAAKRPFDVDTQIVTSSFGAHAISISAASVMLAEIVHDPTRFVPALNDVRYG